MSRTPNNPAIFITNVALGLAALGLMIYFVVGANAVAADRYLIRELNERAVSLASENGLLMAERARVEDPALLADFARKNNMIEARDVAYIFETGRVAVNETR